MLKRVLDHPAIVEWYRAFYQPKAMVLAVSGQVKAAEVQEDVRRLFGALPREQGIRAPSNPAPSPAGRAASTMQATAGTSPALPTSADASAPSTSPPSQSAPTSPSR